MNQTTTLKMETKFKNTATGEIPVDWESVPLEAVATIVMGQSPLSSECNQTGEGLPFYQGNADFGTLYPNPRWWCASPRKRALKGDILISVRAPVGEVNLSPHECCIGRGVAAIRPEKMDPKFLFHSLSVGPSVWRRISQGSTFDAINGQHLASFPIAAPPIPEQRKIAEILSAVDDAIEMTNAVIETTHRLLYSLMQQLLMRGIEHTRFQKTEIGNIPEEWKVVNMKEIGQVVTGGTPDTANRESWDGNFPFVTPMDMGKQKRIIEVNRKVSGTGLETAGRIPANAVMVVCIGSTIGKIGITSKECCANQQVNSVICNDKTVPEYLYYYLLSKVDSLRKLASHTAVPIINKTSFSEFRVPMPKVEEQAKIAEVLSRVDARKADEETYRLQLMKIKAALMQVLLTGKVRAHAT